ncbi:chromatin assembly factor 1 subunit A [Peromyscus eremicus]|uniref:chromatin assembly factor 1 subunit A n=1 Tax=Peromyscus eremicus TaxID=42410 RepID=UPI0027DE35D6|nr:chromatin assembly factor 1 subunit A [Peromyscus eremicus]
MLEEPDAATPRAAAMDCKDRPGFPVKRLIQARLPFKRLNLVPKEKAEDTSPKVSVEDKVRDLQLSLDTLENRCHTGSHVGLSQKLVSGRGPIDSFLRATIKPVQSVVIIDLTENSNDIPDSPEGSNEPSPDAPAEGATKQQGPSTAEQCLPETPSDIPCRVEEEPESPGGPQRTGGCQAGWLQSCPELTEGSRTSPVKEPSGWSKAGNLLFIEKVPMVVLEDILAAKPPHTFLPTMSLDRSITSESEVQESCPEDDSTLSHSSTSSSSPTSSPEGPSAPPAQLSGTSPPSTPICIVAKKLVRGSTEKGRSKLHRDREQQREEKEKLKEETRRAKEEARRRKEEEKELKERERREKREKDEKEKAEKQRLKEERRKERQEALEAKLEEKRKKEEEKRLREEEKRLREEEKRIKAEKAEITRFFQKPKTPQAPKTLAGSCGKFAPFEIKEHMVLAPRCRAALDQDLCDQLDQLLQQQSGASSFLSDLKGRLPLRSGPTQICSRNTDIMDRDVIIVENKVDGVPERRRFGRMKLLQFSENHRPAYWGTWNKKTAIIRPRDPWAQDKNLLDYEVDSDDEWEEEEPGESLSHSEGDEDDDMGEDEDEDDGFFVPHGYLSEDEGVTEECADPENHKVRQKLKAKEWDELLAKGKRFRVLQPVQVGCVWAAEAANCAGSDLKLLQQFTVCLLDAAPPEEPEPRASRREKRDQHILAQLLPLLHGNVNGSKVIIREFQERCRRGLLSPPSPTPHPQTPNSEDAVAVPSKARLKRLISENSAYEKRPDFRMCWYVHPQVLRSFGQECLPVPCQWTYVTAMPSTPREDSGNAPTEGPGQGTPMPIKRKPAATMCITQFMKKRRYDGQVGSGDMDGFQADTEEDEDDDTDCMIVEVPDVGSDVPEAPVPAPTLCK